MKRWGKWGILAMAVSGLVIFGSRLVVSQQPAPMPPPDPFMELFASVRPHIEEVLGCKFDVLPQVVPTSGAINPDSKDDLYAYIRWHFPQVRGDTLAQTWKEAIRITNSSRAARHLEGGNSIAVMVNNLHLITCWDPELVPVNSNEYLQLALVHEVVRWHLDKRYQVSRLREACRDAEEFDALLAVVEGRARAVTRQVAAKLGTEVYFPLLAKCDLHVPDDATDPSIKAVSQTALHARYRAGTRGLAFWDVLDIPDAEARVFAHLPRQMTVLARPDRWLEAQAKNQPDLATVLQTLENTLPSADWQPTQQTWTPTMLLQVTNMLGASTDRAEKIGKSWYEGRSLIWTQRQRPDRQVALNVVRHDGDAGARAYFTFAIDLQRKQDTLPPGTCGPIMRVVESKSTSVKLEGFDEAVRNDKLIAFGDAPPLPVSLLMGRAGNLVIECTWHGQTADPALAEQLLQRLLAASH